MCFLGLGLADCKVALFAIYYGESAGGGEEAPICSAFLLKTLLGWAWDSGWEGCKIIAQNIFVAGAAFVFCRHQVSPPIAGFSFD